jgi:hypothetical protein
MLQENYSATLQPRGEQTPREEEGSRQLWRYWPTEKGPLFYVFYALILITILFFAFIPIASWLLS